MILGFFVGITTAAFNLIAWRLIIRVFVGAPGANNTPQKSLAFLLVLVKLPIFLAAGELMRRTSPSALSSFLVGVGVVYLLLVVWALLQR